MEQFLLMDLILHIESGWGTGYGFLLQPQVCGCIPEIHGTSMDTSIPCKEGRSSAHVMVPLFLLHIRGPPLLYMLGQ